MRDKCLSYLKLGGVHFRSENMAIRRSDLEKAVDLRRQAEIACDEAQDLIDEAQISIAQAREQISRAKLLIRELHAAIAATRRRVVCPLLLHQLARRGARVLDQHRAVI